MTKYVYFGSHLLEFFFFLQLIRKIYFDTILFQNDNPRVIKYFFSWLPIARSFANYQGCWPRHEMIASCVARLIL